MVPLLHIVWTQQVSVPIGLDGLIVKMIVPIPVLFQNLITHLFLLLLLLLKGFLDASE